MDKQSLLSKIRQIQPKPIWVVGDVMLDEFHWCRVSRISPEAPVPVCSVEKTTLIPGGAANVAVNIQALSSIPSLFGVIGQDSSAQKLVQQLQACAISTDYLCKDPDRPTTLKSRIIAHQQQVARVDRESVLPLSDTLQAQLLYHLQRARQVPSAIILSDYHKGTLNLTTIRAFIEYAKIREIPVIVDPKGEDYSIYQGASVLTPNFGEFETAVHKKNLSEAAILEESLGLIKTLELTGLLITRSEKGMSLVQPNGQKKDIPTRAKEVFDITGAGDTVIAVLALALANQWPLEEAAYLANEAAGIVVRKLGTASTSLEEIEQELLAP